MLINDVETHTDDLVQQCLDDPKFFIETFLSIKDKKRRIVPFIFNNIQNKFYNKMLECKKKGINKHIILKPRQLGFTTFMCGLYLGECILVPNTTAVIIAHDKESTAKIFEITRLMYEKLPDEIRPAKKYSSKRELVFEGINSQIFIGTAGSDNFGRGVTINLLHCSEYAFWQDPKTVLTGLLETVPADGTIVFETTANGYNHFYDEYMESKEATDKERKLKQLAYPHFFRWFEHEEYQTPLEESELDYIKESITTEEESLIKTHNLNFNQIAWRRAKVATQKDRFQQEYPENDITCFVSSGSPFFDLNCLNNIVLWNEQNKTNDIVDRDNPEIIVERGWSKTEMEHIKIYKEYKQDFKYVLAVDPAEGNPTSDTSSAFLLRLHKDPIFVEQCAEINVRLPMPKFYKLVYHLGSKYGFPRLAIERNNHGHVLNYWAENGLMQDQVKVLNKYPNVYKAIDNKAGFVTSSGTRPLILDNLSEMIRNNMLVVYSNSFISQARSFVYNESGKPEAETGKNDDAVIAMALGCFILVNDQTSSFKFINEDDFISPSEGRPSVYRSPSLVGALNNPFDNNIRVDLTNLPKELVIGTEIIDYDKYLK